MSRDLRTCWEVGRASCAAWVSCLSVGSRVVSDHERKVPFIWASPPVGGAAGGGQLQNEGVQGRGQHDGLAAEPQAYLVLGGLDVLEGELADRGGGLGVEQDQQPGVTVSGFGAVSVQQLAGVGPAGFAR